MSFSSTQSQQSRYDSDERPPRPQRPATRPLNGNGPSFEPPGMVDFLFIVTELDVVEGHRFSKDVWGNYLPPSDSEDIEETWNQQVYRYRDGGVYTVPGYSWERGEDHGDGAPEGQILREITDSAGRSSWQPCISYPNGSGTTVFNCGPFLPAIVSVPRAPTGWVAMRVRNDGTAAHLTTHYNGLKHVVPRTANWCPSIVPETYRDPNPDNHEYLHGLGGPFGIIIGLMALAQAPGRFDEAVSRGSWRNYQWTRMRDPHSFTALPRGVHVHIAVDQWRQNPEQAMQAIATQENGRPLVMDPSSSNRASQMNARR